MIFVFDVDTTRIVFFENVYGSANVRYAGDIDSAIEILLSEPFEKIFLYHQIYEDKEVGVQLATKIMKMKLALETPIVIHAESKKSAEAMRDILSKRKSKVECISFRGIKKQFK